jgi:hypothetical protein
LLEFRTFLHLLESQLPLESDSNLSGLNLARRFYYASDGVVAYTMKLNDYNVIQIEIAYRYSNGYYEEKLDLDRIEDWLPRVGGMLDCPELTLTRLIWVCQHIKSLHWLKDCSAWQIILNRPPRKLIEFKSKFVTL